MKSNPRAVKWFVIEIAWCVDIATDTSVVDAQKCDARTIARDDVLGIDIACHCRQCGIVCTVETDRMTAPAISVYRRRVLQASSIK